MPRRSEKVSAGSPRRDEDVSPTRRAFDILELVARSGSASVAEVAEAMALPRTTAHRIVSNLEEFGYIHRSVGRGRYVVGPRLVRLAGDALKAGSSLSAAHELLRQIAHEATGTCSLAVLQGGEVTYIDSAVADSPLMLSFQTGQRAPLYCTSSGKTFLATMDRKSFERYLATGPWRGVTGHTIVEPQKLRAEIERTRKRGYAMTGSEFVEGVVGAAVAVPGPGRHPLAALTISVPEVRQSLADLERLIPLLQRSAAKLSKLLLSE